MDIFVSSSAMEHQSKQSYIQSKTSSKHQASTGQSAADNRAFLLGYFGKLGRPQHSKSDVYPPLSNPQRKHPRNAQDISTVVQPSVCQEPGGRPRPSESRQTRHISWLNSMGRHLASGNDASYFMRCVYEGWQEFSTGVNSAPSNAGRLPGTVLSENLRAFVSQLEEDDQKNLSKTCSWISKLADSVTHSRKKYSEETEEILTGLSKPRRTHGED